MNRPLLALAAGLSAAAALLPAPAAAQTAPAEALSAIQPNDIRAHVRFLSSDLLEGRAPGTRGGHLAAQYIASEFEALGLQPVNGSYLQPFPIYGVTVEPEETSLTFQGPAGSFPARWLDDYVSWTVTQKPRADASGEIVWVGYGVNAPEYHWNDYAGVDVTGKIVMMLVNDPPATAAEPDLFGGRAMTYYGRWTYKYEEAERQGAAGAILVHTTESASYPWGVVTSSWGKEQYQLPLKPERTHPLALESWVTHEAAQKILDLAGLSLDSLTAASQHRGFRAIPTGIRATSHIESRVRALQTGNVVGLAPGRSDEIVIYSAHYDHLGIGPAVNGDSIYNGAVDNASGVGLLLSVAKAYSRLDEPTDRSILFVATTAEEAGLLGSEYYAENPLFPLEKTAADINMDIANVVGPTRDLSQLGADRSTLGADLQAIVGPMGMTVKGDEHPEAGSFFRSDHFPFAKVGVPVVSLEGGSEVVGKPAGYGEAAYADYNSHRYHQPADEIREDFDWRGAVQEARIAFLLGYRVANAEEMPQWLPESQFQRK